MTTWKKITSVSKFHDFLAQPTVEGTYTESRPGRFGPTYVLKASDGKTIIVGSSKGLVGLMDSVEIGSLVKIIRSKEKVVFKNGNSGWGWEVQVAAA
ncbi:MAG: hypothetical protein ABSC50_14265 [Candidatus Bathyarchaeia archaeon]|jgi:hypothetical protein